MENLNLDVLDGKEVKKLTALNSKIATLIQNHQKIYDKLETQVDTLINSIKNEFELKNPNYNFVVNMENDEFEQRDCFKVKKIGNQYIDQQWICDVMQGSVTGGFAIHINHGTLS